jgi:hypothetical protein
VVMAELNSAVSHFASGLSACTFGTNRNTVPVSGQYESHGASFAYIGCSRVTARRASAHVGLCQ